MHKKWLKNEYLLCGSCQEFEPYAEEIITERNSHDIIDNTVINFSQHPSILKIKDYVKITVKFSFLKKHES